METFQSVWFLLEQKFNYTPNCLAKHVFQLLVKIVANKLYRSKIATPMQTCRADRKYRKCSKGNYLVTKYVPGTLTLKLNGRFFWPKIFTSTNCEALLYYCSSIMNQGNEGFSPPSTGTDKHRLAN